MIAFKKLGRIDIGLNLEWQTGGVITPTPYQLDDNTFRVFAGFRDNEGVSRIGYIDLDSDNPLIVKKLSTKPSLDVGRNGCFDDNGMILGDVKVINSKLYMFYIGFQLVKKVKFLAFTGLAVSEDQGETFVRVSEAPILDRGDHASTIRAIHSVNMINNKVMIYYAVGDSWEYIAGNPYPKYEIYCSLFDLGNLDRHHETKCISVKAPEYRIGKPTVYQIENGYMMFYTRGRSNDLSYYEPGIAFSEDGINWERRDSQCPSLKGREGWDSINTAYPRIVENKKGDQFLFYSGNNMGSGGFGVAKITNKKVIYSQEIYLGDE